MFKKKRKTPELTLSTLDSPTSKLFIQTMPRSAVTPSSAHPFSGDSFNEELHSDAVGLQPYQTEPIQILPHLYLGSEKNASRLDLMLKLNIHYILNCGKECKNHFDQMAEEKKSGSSNSLSTGLSEDLIPVSPVYNPLNLIGRQQQSFYSQQSHSQPNLSQHSSTPPLSAMSQPDFCTDQTPIQETLESLESLHLHQQQEQLQSDLKYLKLPWLHNQENIQSYFKEAFEFIDEALNNKQSILIHCKQGLSRSATLVMAYLMREYRMKTNEAYEFVKEKSPNVSPNLGLIYQLHEYETALGLRSEGEGLNRVLEETESALNSRIDLSLDPEKKEKE